VTSETYWCEYAWCGLFGDAVEPGVLLEVEGGLITSASSRTDGSPPGATVLRGVTIPGMANSHSHSFHRALRGRTEGRGDSPTTFWDWRDQMYDLAAKIQPEWFMRLARATFAEMALAGITVVGEFHYLRNDPDGNRYSDPNVMAKALIAAAGDAGIRLTLLDTCYLHGGIGSDGYAAASPPQRRFVDPDAESWAARASNIAGNATTLIGAAVHSVRAVDPVSIALVSQWASDSRSPLHAHVSEQVVENEACESLHTMSPTCVFAEAGAIDERFTAVHGTHLSEQDMRQLGGGRSTVCLCPTTERDLADGVGQAAAVAAAGCELAVGSDSQSVIDLLEEARAIELDQRLTTQRRGHHSPAALLRAATSSGYRSLGWSNGGTLQAGALADFTTLRKDSPRLAGQRISNLLAGIVFSATAADVTNVVVNGKTIVSDGQHLSVEVGLELREALS